jgi:hypothetical protein
MKKKVISLGLVFITLLAMGCTGQISYIDVDSAELIADTDYYLNQRLDTKLYVEYDGSIDFRGNGYRLFYGYNPDYREGSVAVIDPMNFLDDESTEGIKGIVIMGTMNNETTYFLFVTQDSSTAECIVAPTMTQCGGGGDDGDIIIIPIPYD